MGKRLPSFVQGALGALVVGVILLSGLWIVNRYREFVVIRQVVFQAISKSNAPPAK